MTTTSLPFSTPPGLCARILCVLALFAGLAGANAQSISLSKPKYQTGENISVTFTNAPGNAKDWVGIYPKGIVPGAQASTLWYYLDGTQSGSQIKTFGTLTFGSGLSKTGDFTAFLLVDDGYTSVASVDFTLVLAPSIAISKGALQTNETFSISFTNAPGNVKDWVGIYPQGAEPGGPTSTLWFYLDGTKSGATVKTSGALTFTNGLAKAGNWTAYLLENDGYTKLATLNFRVGAVIPPPAVTTVVTDHSQYFTGEKITVAFTNGPANPKDWVGIYPEGVLPGGPASTIWAYTDGATGLKGTAQGTVTFATGLKAATNYLAYLLENDGYKILASNRFSVVEPTAPLVRVDKKVYIAKEAIMATFTNGPANPTDWIGIYPKGIVPGSVGSTSTLWFYVNGTQSASDGISSGTIGFTNGLRTTGEWVAYLLENDAYNVLAQEAFTVVAAPVVPTNNIVLGTPIYFENFDSTGEGGLPLGWTQQNFTDSDNENLDLTDLNSKSFASWLVISAARFQDALTTYSRTPSTDYRRVLTFNPDNYVNGSVVSNLASGNILFADSGYRNGRSQVQYVSTPDYNLSGRTDIHVSYHSLFEQNQDSLGALEYSIDKGTNWLPIIYMIDAADIIRLESGEVDAVATLTTDHSDVAFYDDPVTGETKGGTYGAFIGAPITQALAPFISGRANDDPIESKRVEYFRVPQADNQATVRFRFLNSGTDSWYFGVDDFGIYGSGSAGELRIKSVVRTGSNITITWDGASGVKLQRASSLVKPVWQDVAGTAGASSAVEALQGTAAFYRLTRN